MGDTGAMRERNEGEGRGSAGSLRLTIATPGDNETFELAGVDSTTTPTQILEELVAQGLLPAPPAGQSYRLGLRDRHVLDDRTSLAANGVGNEAMLLVISSTPGAAPGVTPLALATVPSQPTTTPTTEPALAAPAGRMPVWLRELEQLRRARAAHVFLLHLNVHDYVYDGLQMPHRLTSYLARYLQAAGCDRLGSVTLADGLVWADGGEAPKGREDLVSGLRRLEGDLHRHNGQRVGVIIENLEHIAPRERGDQDSARAAEILTRIAQDESLRAGEVVVVATCASPEAVAASLVESPGGARCITVGLPSAEDRRRFLRYLADSAPAVRLAPLADGLTIDGIVNVSQGVSLAGLDAVNRAAQVAGTPLSYTMLRAHKREAIERQSKGLIEELEPRLGFDAIGGLAHVLGYLRGVVDHLRHRRLEWVPKGILLAGAPGTGKTLVAEALAKEASFNLVRLGDVRSMWVGESERNLSHLLRLLLELEPVVVFVDEVDQMLGSRDSGLNGDSGVSARLFGRILNFMGRNEHRGRVVWIAATNRPDLLDEAMLRRFDRVFPFFLPGRSERGKIFAAMPKITGIVYAPDVELAPMIDASNGLTGSAIEVVVRRAAELAAGAPIDSAHLLAAAEDYKPNHDPRTYTYQSLVALAATNLYSSLPALEDMPEDIADAVRAMRAQCSPAPLHERLRELRAQGCTPTAQ
ncbi:MAG TPA: ATP-binding protein [Methylomirabilota bacterium]|jgi:transitional endoplasmic reticulum ATPase|nr:ATP-binding protein [Methylomirabilota bacterium]